MVYLRPERETYTFQGRTQTGWKQIGTLTSNKKLAERIETMWGELAETQENWDLLGRVMGGQMKITELYRLWFETNKNPVKIRKLLDDTDLDPIVTEFLGVYGRKVKPDTLAHVEYHIRALIPQGKRFTVSQATTDRLSSLLYRYPGKQNTLRKVHSDVSVFFEYCTRVKKYFDRNPMDSVDRPTVEDAGVRFYEMDAVERIIGHQADERKRALFALMYGAAIEVSTALALTRSDINPATHEVRAAGTKTSTRDRSCRVADWAWPIVWEHAKTILPAAKLWPTWTRWTVSDWHRQTIEKLDLPAKYPLHCARHHWAVRAIRSGAPIAMVQTQLGHGSPDLTLRVYGRFRPDATDRAKWEQAAPEYDEKRRNG